MLSCQVLLRNVKIKYILKIEYGDFGNTDMEQISFNLDLEDLDVDINLDYGLYSVLELIKTDKETKSKYQKHLNKNTKKIRVHNKVPTYNKSDKIQEHIKEWNTIKHVYRYQTLYKICEELFNLTIENKIECLTYFVDVEYDEYEKICTYAIDESLSNSSICERVKAHIELLRRVYRKDNTLKYDNNKKVISDTKTIYS